MNSEKWSCVAWVAFTVFGVYRSNSGQVSSLRSSQKKMPNGMPCLSADLEQRSSRFGTSWPKDDPAGAAASLTFEKIIQGN